MGRNKSSAKILFSNFKNVILLATFGDKFPKIFSRIYLHYASRRAEIDCIRQSRREIKIFNWFKKNNITIIIYYFSIEKKNKDSKTQRRLII